MRATALFKASLLLLALGFTAVFFTVVIPPLWQSKDIFAALAAGFVNPYASGYSFDVFFTWAVLAVWVIYDSLVNNVRHGWLALLLGVVPGVAVGLAVYLLIRHKQAQA